MAKKQKKPEGFLPLSHTSFGGLHSEQYNALRSALRTAALEAGYKGEYAEYNWLDDVPRASMSIALVDALHRHGYQITQIPKDAQD